MNYADRTAKIAARFVAAAILAGSPCTVLAQDVLVYDDALRNGFLDFSYGGGANFASPSPVHAGTQAIALAGNDFNAIGLANVGTDFDTATHPVIHFWIHGGSSGGQPIDITLQTTDAMGESTLVATGDLGPYIAGGAPVANAWREVTVRIGDPPLSYSGPYDRIDLQYQGASPSTFSVDDVRLQAAATGGPDPLFAHGFEGGAPPPTPVNALQIEHDVTVNGLVSERYTWRDRDGEPRVAVLAHNDGPAGPNGQRGGELWEYRYQTPAGTRVVRSTGQFAGGFGYVVSHRNEGTTGIPGDDSPLGHGFAGTWTRVFEGRHHAILRFRQNYPRYSRTDAPIPNTRYDVPVTIEWLVATGRDHPLWAMTWDLTGVPANALRDDTRAPYGELLFDGAASAGAHSVIAGVGWGDRYKFVTTTSPVTKMSQWTWNVPNTIPYVKLWTTAVDATMGTVQTQTITQQDSGGYFGTDRWNTTSAAGNACTAGGNDYRMPCDYNWPYQSINYSLGGNTDATNNTRLAWGANFGALGQQSYATHGSAFWGGPLPNTFASGWPYRSYGVYVVLDRHTVDPVGAQVAEIEAVQTVTATAAIGTVRTSGPGGVARSDNVPYAPAGWNAVRGAWAFDASANRLDANLAVGSGTLAKPLVIVSGWTAGALPAQVRYNGTTLVLDVDYYPSLRADANELWLTLARDLAGAANRLEIAP